MEFTGMAIHVYEMPHKVYDAVVYNLPPHVADSEA